MKAKFFVLVKGANGSLLPINYRQITHIERNDTGGKAMIGQSRIYFPGYAVVVMGDPTEVAAKIEEQISHMEIEL